MSRQVALLRAINLGARNRVPMAELRKLMEDLGYKAVRTHLQSGNVIFDGRKATAPRLATALEQAFGFPIPVVLRTRDELAAVVAANPLAGVADDPRRHQVLFCSDDVTAERVAGLDPAAFAPEAFRVSGREVHVWSPAGVQGSPVLRALAPPLAGLTVTARNWRTVEALLALADADGL